MKLENWALYQGNLDPYTPPELARIRLFGDVYGSDDRPDGTPIITSYIVDSEVFGEEIKCKTYSGSIYELGAVSPEYEALFPNAKERTIAAILKAKP